MTIRLIRSFEHRNIRHLVLHDVNPLCTVDQLMRRLDDDGALTVDVPLHASY